MTSNVGSRRVVRRTKQVGFSTSAKHYNEQIAPRTEYRTALEATFPPEFLNRIDDVIIFRSLTPEDVEQIVDIEFAGIVSRVDQLGYKLRITPTAKRMLAQSGYQASYGARALRRTLQQRVEQPLARLLVGGELRKGDTIVVEKRAKSEDLRLKIA